MTRQGEGEERADITAQLQPLVDDDAFLTSLSEGVDPSEGADELATLFLELREDVEKQMPPAPVIEGADEEPAVISLGARRRRRGANPWVAGLIGAAAATVVVAGSGAALYNAAPGSPLWGASTAVFGDRTAVVELAGTLDDMQVAADNGDIEGTRALLEQARSLVDALQDPSDKSQTSSRPTPRPTATVTHTETVEPEPAPAEREDEPEGPVTVTETAPAPGAGEQPARETVTVTQTQVATVTVQAPARQNPIPAESQAPSDDGGESVDSSAQQGPDAQVARPQNY
ncbi:hypothetical protein [Corynebacterium sp.]|uniref:hypothetical protein n=1 Tax=Corynebacterium sp. TaxID=1720 RepID=UPI003734D4C7